MSVIQINNLHKVLGGKEILKGIDLEIHQGEVVAILGPSGSGKSTLLRCMNGLEESSEGEVLFQGQELGSEEQSPEDMDAIRAKIGMVFQHFNLFPHLTIRENISLAPQLVLGKGKEESEDQAAVLLDQVGLVDKLDAYPDQLSGGQKQRVAIARALAMEPELMLFDEPTSALDPEMIKEVLKVIADLAETGMTIVIVTHEMGFAREVANRILFLADGQIVEDTSPKAFFTHPESERAQVFLSNIM